MSDRGERSAPSGAAADSRLRSGAWQRLFADVEASGARGLGPETLHAMLAPPRDAELARLSTRVLAASMPLLAAHAARAYRRRLARSLLMSLAPLPVLVFFNVYLLREAHALLSTWLPDGVVAWLVVGYATMLMLLCALTYAALPLLIARARVEAAPAP